MRWVRGAAALPPTLLLACWCSTAQAYRPFDGTDAAVAETGELEIEFGALEYLREAAERALFAPNLRINYGFTPGWEAVVEGEVAHGFTAGIPGTSVVGNGAHSSRRSCRRRVGGERGPDHRYWLELIRPSLPRVAA